MAPARLWDMADTTKINSQVPEQEREESVCRCLWRSSRERYTDSVDAKIFEDDGGGDGEYRLKHDRRRYEEEKRAESHEDSLAEHGEKYANGVPQSGANGGLQIYGVTEERGSGSGDEDRRGERRDEKPSASIEMAMVKVGDPTAREAAVAPCAKKKVSAEGTVATSPTAKKTGKCPR